MNPTRSTLWLPALAVLGSVTSLCIGTSFAKKLFPLIGAEGTSALRVGFSALVLLIVWRPWRWPLSRRDAGSVIRVRADPGRDEPAVLPRPAHDPLRDRRGDRVQWAFGGGDVVVASAGGFRLACLCGRRPRHVAAAWPRQPARPRGRRAGPGRRRVLGPLHRLRQEGGAPACGAFGLVGAGRRQFRRRALWDRACGSELC